MRYLIDTHILVWYLNGDEKLSQPFRNIINDNNNIIIVSVATLWEIAIKLTKENRDKKSLITLPELKERMMEQQFQLLNISFEHLNIITSLPQHHGDPFDRLIIAQAISEGVTLISVDKLFAAYPVILAS